MNMCLSEEMMASDGVATHSLSLQVWWAKVKEFGLSHVPKTKELWFLLVWD